MEMYKYKYKNTSTSTSREGGLRGSGFPGLYDQISTEWIPVHHMYILCGGAQVAETFLPLECPSTREKGRKGVASPKGGGPGNKLFPERSAPGEARKESEGHIQPERCSGNVSAMSLGDREC